MEIILDKPKSIFKIFKEAIGLYFRNFFKLTLVMVYPILAHLIGIPLIFLAAFGLPEQLPFELIINHKTLVVAIIVVAIIPGFALFLSGFWAYLVAMVSLNRLTKGIIDNDRAITAKSCAEFVNNRKQPYAYILCLMMLLWIVGFIITLIPALLTFFAPFWLALILVIIVGFISLILVLCLSVYFSLCFQVFAFEEVSVIDVFKRSFKLIDNNFFRTLLLLIGLYFVTGIIAPIIVHMSCEILGIVKLASGLVTGFVDTLLTQIQGFDSQYHTSIFSSISKVLIFAQDPVYEISKTIIILTIDGVVTAGMLPLGTICFTLLYFDINSRKQVKD